MATYTTLDEARTAYLANADYASGTGSTTKADAFRTACRSLLALMPQSAGQGGGQVTMSMTQIAEDLKRVENWLAAAPSASSGRCSWTRARVIP